VRIVDGWMDDGWLISALAPCGNQISPGNSPGAPGGILVLTKSDLQSDLSHTKIKIN
jgi:hypothetical protein